jgi:hypothetical protein
MEKVQKRGFIKNAYGRAGGGGKEVYLDGGQWSPSRPGRSLPPGKGPPVPIGQEAGWAPEPVCMQSLEERSSCRCRVSNLDHPVVQTVARQYTDWTTPAPYCDGTWIHSALITTYNQHLCGKKHIF